MKAGLIFVFAMMLSASYSQVKTAADPFNKSSIGISAGQYFCDAGVMVTATSSYYKGRVAFRISGGFRWSEFTYAEMNIPARYSSLQAGMVNVLAKDERIRLYSEVGMNMVFPNSIFSEKKRVPGVYGSLGTDLYILKTGRWGLAYFMAVGVSLNPARAEKLESRPLYSSGVTALTGFRFHI